MVDFLPAVVAGGAAHNVGRVDWPEDGGIYVIIGFYIHIGVISTRQKMAR